MNREMFIPILFFAILACGNSCSTKPKHGERVKAPEGLSEQLHEYFAKKERMAIAEIKFFRCDSITLGDEVIPNRPGYQVRVKLQNADSTIPQFKSIVVSDRDNVDRGSGKWEFNTFPDHSWGTQPPCENKILPDTLKH